MKELSVIEMESISGAYSWDFSSLGSAISSIASNGVEAVASALLLGAITAGGGSIVGGSHGSDNGGIFWGWYYRYDDRWTLWPYRWRN